MKKQHWLKPTLILIAFFWSVGVFCQEQNILTPSEELYLNNAIAELDIEIDNEYKKLLGGEQ